MEGVARAGEEGRAAEDAPEVGREDDGDPGRALVAERECREGEGARAPLFGADADLTPAGAAGLGGERSPEPILGGAGARAS